MGNEGDGNVEMGGMEMGGMDSGWKEMSEWKDRRNARGRRDVMADTDHRHVAGNTAAGCRAAISGQRFIESQLDAHALIIDLDQINIGFFHRSGW